MVRNVILGVIVAGTLVMSRPALAAQAGTPVVPRASAVQQKGPRCDDTAPWLAESAVRVDPLFNPLIFPGESGPSLADYRASLIAAQRAQSQSQPPLAAKDLDAQIRTALALISIAAGSADDMNDLQRIQATNERWLNAVQHMLSLSRELKRMCNLSQSPQFFDASCYGPEAVEWYRRTYARALAVQQFAVELQEDARSLPAGDETAKEFGERAARQSDTFRREQEAEVTPEALTGLQRRYVDLYRLVTDMWATIFPEGPAGLEQVRSDVQTATAALHREMARLDIACPAA